MMLWIVSIDFKALKERKSMNLFPIKNEQKKTKKLLASILFLSLFCLSTIFTALAGPGELYQKKLESQTLDKGNDSELRIGKKLFQTEVGKKEEQLLVMLDHELSLWNKGEDRYYLQWKTYNGYGRNGLKEGTERKEGDGTTPLGAYPISFAFGFPSSVNTQLPYKQIQKTSYWSGEKNTYNTWVESPTKIAGERLYSYKICYDKALAIGFNQNPVVFGRGSAIFLHIKAPDTWESSGCITISKEAMEEMLPLLKERLSILTVQKEEELQKY